MEVVDCKGWRIRITVNGKMEGVYYKGWRIRITVNGKMEKWKVYIVRDEGKGLA